MIPGDPSRKAETNGARETTKNKSTTVTVDHSALEQLVERLRRLGVLHFEVEGMKLVLGPLPADPTAKPARDARQQPQDALDLAMGLRSTRPDEGKKDPE